MFGKHCIQPKSIIYKRLGNIRWDGPKKSSWDPPQGRDRVFGKQCDNVTSVFRQICWAPETLTIVNVCLILILILSTKDKGSRNKQTVLPRKKKKVPTTITTPGSHTSTHTGESSRVQARVEPRPCVQNKNNTLFTLQGPSLHQQRKREINSSPSPSPLPCRQQMKSASRTQQMGRGEQQPTLPNGLFSPLPLPPLPPYIPRSFSQRSSSVRRLWELQAEG